MYIARIVPPLLCRRYKLDELLAQCNPARRTKEENDWLDGKPAGGELI